MSTTRRGVTLGVVSLITIFTVVCLVTFGALALVSAGNDLALAEKTAEASRQYYAAQVKAEETVAALARGEEPPEVTFSAGEGGRLAAFDIPINEQKILHTEVFLATNAKGVPSGQAERRQSVVIATGDWQDAPYLPVY